MRFHKLEGRLLLLCRNGVRLVTHNDVTVEDCKQALVAIKDVLGSEKAANINGNSCMYGTTDIAYR